MHDNARQRSAEAVRDYLREIGIHIFDRPPKSHDLNHVENIWDPVEKRIRARKNPLTSLASLTPVVIQEWEAHPRKRSNISLSEK